MKSFIKDNQTKSLGFKASNAGNAFSLAVVFLLFFSIFTSIIIKTLNLDGGFAYFLNYIPAPVSVIFAILALYLRGQKDCFKLLKPNKVAGYSVISALLIIVGLLVGLSKLNEYFVEFLELFGLSISVPELPELSLQNLIFAVIFICIIPTITEEILMRKIILDGLSEVGEVFAIFASGFIFSIFHMNPAQTLYQFIVGCAFAYIVLKGGNYFVTMIAHLLNNLFIVLNYYFFKISYDGILEVIITILGILCFIVGVIILAVKGKKLNVKMDKNKAIDFLIGSIVGILICISMWISSLMV